MKFKKLLLSLGSIAAVSTPIAAVISCGEPGSSQYSESDLLRMSNLKSSEAKAKLQDLWLTKTLIQEYNMPDTVTPTSLLETIPVDTAAGSFYSDFKNTLSWVLKDKLFESKDALSTIYQSLKTNAPESIIGDSNGTGALTVIEFFNKKIFGRGDIETAVNNILGDDTWVKALYNKTFEGTGDDKELTYNPSILGVKDLILKMMLTKKFMSKSSDQYKDKLPAEYAKLASKFRDSTLINGSAENFPLIVSAMNGRYAYENSISLTEAKSTQFIDVSKENEFADVDTAIKSFGATTSTFKSAFPWSFTKQTMVDGILARKMKDGLDLGFKGVVSLPSGKDALNTSTASSIKLVKAGGRDGFIYNKDSENQIVSSNIRWTDKDKTKVELNYYTSLMPYMYTPTGRTSETLGYDPTQFGKNTHTDINSLDSLMNIVYTKDTSLYSTAISYFTAQGADKDVEKQVLIKVTNDWARNYYIDEGIKYIDPEK